MATRGQLKHGKSKAKAEEDKPVVSGKRGRNARNFSSTADTKSKPTPKATKPKPTPAAVTKSAKAKAPVKKAAKSAVRSAMADWAAKERAGLGKEQQARKHVQASVGQQAGQRTAKRMDSPMRKLKSAVQPSKRGYESYKSFMGG